MPSISVHALGQMVTPYRQRTPLGVPVGRCFVLPDSRNSPSFLLGFLRHAIVYHPPLSVAVVAMMSLFTCFSGVFAWLIPKRDAKESYQSPENLVFPLMEMPTTVRATNLPHGQTRPTQPIVSPPIVTGLSALEDRVTGDSSPSMDYVRQYLSSVGSVSLLHTRAAQVS